MKADEPKYTQPEFYQLIEKHTDPKTLYTQQLIEQKVVTADEVKQMEKSLRNELNESLERVRNHRAELGQVEPDDEWVGYSPA